MKINYKPLNQGVVLYYASLNKKKSDIIITADPEKKHIAEKEQMEEALKENPLVIKVGNSDLEYLLGREVKISPKAQGMMLYLPDLDDKDNKEITLIQVDGFHILGFITEEE